MFRNVQQGPVDPMFDLKKLADNDTSPEKVDLGVGIYRNENGQYHEMEAIKEVILEILSYKNYALLIYPSCDLGQKTPKRKKPWA